MNLAQVEIYVPDDAGVETFQRAIKLVKEKSQEAQQTRLKNLKRNN